jgi:ElaB/YqjD/DUF883 family membrane-anchored ribosome-binding protein
MTDFPNNDKGNSPLSDFQKPLKHGVDQALAAGRDLQRSAADLAQSSADVVKSQASDLMDVAKDIASQAGDRLQDKVNDQKGVGADYVGKFADSMYRAAGEFDSNIPLAAKYIRKAASQVEGASDAIRDGDFNDLVRGAQSFARQQPTAFFGLAVLAGFGAIRFLKSSAASSGPDETRSQTSQSSFGDSFEANRRPTMRSDFVAR